MKKNKALSTFALFILSCTMAFSLGYSSRAVERRQPAPTEQPAETAVFENELSFDADYGLPVEFFENVQVKNDFSEGHLLASTNILPITNTSSAAVVKAVSDSIVSIEAMISTDGSNKSTGFTAAGSGIIFAEDETKIYIVTNHHVIQGTTSITISVDDKRRAPARHVGSDALTDIAVLSVDKDVLLKSSVLNYKVAIFGDSDKLEVGQSVVALGNALGEGKSATYGIISLKEKKISIDGIVYTAIQTDAAINPGNSGGALVSMDGKVIGLNSSKSYDSYGRVEGMGYSIPINVVGETARNIVQKGGSIADKRPYFGIYGIDITTEIKNYYKLPAEGVFVLEVDPGSTAEALRLGPGDIIVELNGNKITSMDDLTNVIISTKIGAAVRVKFYRGSTLAVTDAIMKGL